MTADEIVTAALAEAQDFIGQQIVSPTVAYARISQRQRQLFDRASQLNDEYFGVCAVGTLDPGTMALDLAKLVDPMEAIERITRIEIAESAGAGAPPVGERVNPVTPDDPDAGVPPRVTIRNKVAYAVGSDLTGVTKLKVHYSRRPLTISAGITVAEIPSPFDYLLVYDLAKFYIRRVLRVDSPKRAEALTLLTGLEDELLAEFDAHVASFAPWQRRFD